MKIGILTFHCAINYGAVLQTYGLQETLKSMGHEVYVIDYRPEYLQRPYRLFFPDVLKGHGFWGNIRFFIRELIALPIRYKRRCAFNRFVEKHLHLANLDFRSGDNDFDCFVFGSDQIWNPQITEGDSFFLGDSPCFKDKKMLTYAASAGSVTALNEIDVEQLRGWLSKFSALSVREKSLSHYLSEKLQLENQLVVDPVLLAGKNVYRKISSYRTLGKPYLLFFSIGQNDEVLDFAKKKAASLGLELIQLYGMAEVIKNRRVLQSLSPNDFMGYFQNAQFVISSSFHGTIFSILFHKLFLCVGHDFKSRFHSLLDMLGMQDRLVDIDNINEYVEKEIDWEYVDNVLAQKREEAFSFLNQALQK